MEVKPSQIGLVAEQGRHNRLGILLLSVSVGTQATPRQLVRLVQLLVQIGPTPNHLNLYQRSSFVFWREASTS
jgi:hypothetical protein